MPSCLEFRRVLDRKSTRLNSSHTIISYAVFCLKTQSQHGSWHGPLGHRGHQVGPISGDDDLGGPGAGDFVRFDEVSEVAFLNDTATTEIYTLSLHDALPI